LVSSIVATAVATVYLSCRVLVAIRQDMRDRPADQETDHSLLQDVSADFDSSRDSATSTTTASSNASSALSLAVSETTRWVINDKGKLPLILLLSVTRLQSLAILKLRIRDRELLDYPMQDRHLHFLRNAGLFKHLVADIPGALISWVLVHASSGRDRDTMLCGDEGSALSSVNVASATLWCKVLLICWGFAKASSQLLLTGAFGVEQPSGEVLTNGDCQVETALSVLRRSFITAGAERDTRAEYMVGERLDRPFSAENEEGGAIGARGGSE
jgi:hypothetical protein